MLVSLAGCGGGDGGSSDDLAKGKLFDQADVQRCLRGGGYRLERRNTDTEIDFTARSRSGLVTADFGVESGPDQAEAREAAWTKLAEEAEVENAGDYYFRYGNVVVAFERVPSASDRAGIERCLS